MDNDRNLDAPTLPTPNAMPALDAEMEWTGWAPIPAVTDAASDGPLESSRRRFCAGNGSLKQGEFVGCSLPRTLAFPWHWGLLRSNRSPARIAADRSSHRSLELRQSHPEPTPYRIRALSIPPPITAATKVADLLQHYPELEEVLIAMAPPFVKLRNPLLRRSVAKVASLRQAAAVGRLSVDAMVDQLRAVVGQAPLASEEHVGEESYFTPRPDWFGEDRVVVSFDEREMDPDVMPLTSLLRRAAKTADGEILELVTTFLPAPGIDILRNKGFATWTTEDDGLVRTYACRIPGPS